MNPTPEALLTRHKTLLTRIRDELGESGHEYESFIEHMKGYVPRGLLSSKKNLLEKFEALATKGHLKPGKYDVLKKICEDSGNQKLKEFVEEAEKSMQSMEEKSKPSIQASVVRSPVQESTFDHPAPSKRPRADVDRSDPLFTRDSRNRGFYDSMGKRGLLLILNSTENRRGTEMDVKNLRDFYEKELQFVVFDPRSHENKDLTTEQVDQVLEEVQRQLNGFLGKQFYCFVCVILSHGNENGIKTKNGLKSIDDIRECFNNENIPNFTGRPKIFLIQACRGMGHQSSQVIDDADDEGPTENVCPDEKDESDELIEVPTDADTLLAFATTLGYRSFRRVSVGSWFITECIGVFRDCYRTDHLEDMLITPHWIQLAAGWDVPDQQILSTNPLRHLWTSNLQNQVYLSTRKDILHEKAEESVEKIWHFCQVPCRSMSYILAVLIMFRLGWSVLPQNGYIHPDEFFQTVEVMAGDTLNISVVRTWEFQQSYPLRSVVLLRLIFSPVFKILSYMEERTSFHITGYSLLASYRFVMSIMSLWIDICIFKICKIIGLNGYSSNILLAGSYVTLTFQTHTFTNSFETVLFVSLILLIFMCIREDEQFKWKKCGINFFTKVDEREDTLIGETVAAINDDIEIEDDLNSSFNELHKLAFHLRKRKSAEVNKRPRANDEDREDSSVPESCKNQQKMQSTNISTNQTKLYMYIGLLAATVTAGIFNRPTFICFCTLPLLWWTDKYLFGSINIIKRVALFMFTGVILSFLFVAVDSAYFTGIQLLPLFTLDGFHQVCQSYVVTPFNFFMYNSVTSNLVSHGHHPCYVHLFFNMPLLFGPMLLYLGKPVLSKIMTASKFLQRSVCNEEKLPARGYVSLEESLNTKLKEAIILFVFFPVVVLSFFPHQEARFLIPLLPLIVISVVLFSKGISKWFWTIFVIFNVLFSFLFGVLHQGGVVPCLLKLQGFVETDQNNSFFTVIFSHTYMPPKHLLLTQSEKVEILDLKGANLQTVFSEIKKHKYSFSNLTDSAVTYKGKKVLFVIPGTLVSEFSQQYDKFLSFKSQEKFFPHLSFEDPPDFKNIDCFETLFDMLSLYLIEIE